MDDRKRPGADPPQRCVTAAQEDSSPSPQTAIDPRYDVPLMCCIVDGDERISDAMLEQIVERVLLDLQESSEFTPPPHAGFELFVPTWN